MPVFFTRYEYGAPVSSGSITSITHYILLVTAIAQPQPLEQYLQQQGHQILQHYRFADHHAYTAAELEKILFDWHRYSQDKTVSIVTTRKDAAKLMEPALAAIWQNIPVFYIPVRVTFVQNQIDFDTLILNHLASKSKVKPEIN